MTDIKREERRSGIDDRRELGMDRRQFVDIGWSMENERRTGAADRRQGDNDRRK